MRGNNDETVNWISMIVKNMADVDRIAPWSDDSLCTMTSSQPPVTQQDIVSTTATDKALTMLRNYIENYIEKGVVFMGDRVVVPMELRARKLDTL